MLKVNKYNKLKQRFKFFKSFNKDFLYVLAKKNKFFNYKLSKCFLKNALKESKYLFFFKDEGSSILFLVAKKVKTYRYNYFQNLLNRQLVKLYFIKNKASFYQSKIEKLTQKQLETKYYFFYFFKKHRVCLGERKQIKKKYLFNNFSSDYSSLNTFITLLNLKDTNFDLYTILKNKLDDDNGDNNEIQKTDDLLSVMPLNSVENKKEVKRKYSKGKKKISKYDTFLFFSFFSNFLKEDLKRKSVFNLIYFFKNHYIKNVKQYEKRKLTFLRPKKSYSMVSKFFLRFDESNQEESNYKYKLKQLKLFNLYYGGFSKKQLKCLCARALKGFSDAVLLFLKLLESRLDVAIFRLGFHPTILAAKQDILHGKILVNDKIITYYTYELKDFDILSFEKNFKKILKKNFISSINKKRKKDLFIRIKKNLSQEKKEKLLGFISKKNKNSNFVRQLKPINILQRVNFFEKIEKKKFIFGRAPFLMQKIGLYFVTDNSNRFSHKLPQKLILKNPIPSFYEANFRTLEFVFMQTLISFQVFNSFDSIDYSYIFGIHHYYL